MRRRTFLAALALSPTAGCVAPGDGPSTNDSTPAATSPPRDTPTPTVTPPPDDPILFIVGNDTDREQTVTLTVTRNETTVLDETETLAAGASFEYDPGIGATGEYTISVAVDGGPTRTIDRNIGRFDVRNGSNHFVDITTDEIRIYWEE